MMIKQGNIRKMQTELKDQVDYHLPIGNKPFT